MLEGNSKTGRRLFVAHRPHLEHTCTNAKKKERGIAEKSVCSVSLTDLFSNYECNITLFKIGGYQDIFYD